eukprot:XP_001700352.1 predicted protein [Chlamydomonas reinhardtii]
MGHSRSRSRSLGRSPKRQRRDRQVQCAGDALLCDCFATYDLVAKGGSGSPRGRSRSPNGGSRRHYSRSPSRSRSPGGGFGGRPAGYSPSRHCLENLYGRGKLGASDLEYACVEFLELLGPQGGMAVLDEFASLDFFRIRNLTAFFIGICKRALGQQEPAAAEQEPAAQALGQPQPAAAALDKQEPASGAAPRHRPNSNNTHTCRQVALRPGRPTAAPPQAPSRKPLLPPRPRASANNISTSSRTSASAGGGGGGSGVGLGTPAGGAGPSGAGFVGEGGLLRQAVTEHVKEALKPAWRANRLTRETFKAVAKKAVDKVLDMLPDGGAGGAYDTPGGVAAFFGDPGRRDSIARVVESLLS